MNNDMNEWVNDIRKALMPALMAIHADADMSKQLEACRQDWKQRCKEAGIIDDMITRTAVITALIPIVMEPGIDPYSLPDALANLVLSLIDDNHNE